MVLRDVEKASFYFVHAELLPFISFILNASETLSWSTAVNVRIVDASQLKCSLRAPPSALIYERARARISAELCGRPAG